MGPDEAIDIQNWYFGKVDVKRETPLSWKDLNTTQFFE